MEFLSSARNLSPPLSLRTFWKTGRQSARVPVSAEQLRGFRQHFRIKAPHSLEFIDSAYWDAACLE